MGEWFDYFQPESQMHVHQKNRTLMMKEMTTEYHTLRQQANAKVAELEKQLLEAAPQIHQYQVEIAELQGQLTEAQAALSASSANPDAAVAAAATVAPSQEALA